MNRERRPRTPMEAQQMYRRGSRSRQVMQALPQPINQRRVISEWEAKAFADMRVQDLTERARSLGFTVGGRPKAVEDLREHILHKEIPLRYIVVPD